MLTDEENVPGAPGVLGNEFINTKNTKYISTGLYVSALAYMQRVCATWIQGVDLITVKVALIEWMGYMTMI